MKKSRDILNDLAFSQWGLFTTAQATHAGVSRTQLNRMEKDGRLESMRRGVYRQAAGEETSHSRIKAAWLATNPKERASERLKADMPDFVVGGRTAACLLGMGDFYETPYNFISSIPKRTRQNDLIYREEMLGLSDIVYIEGLPVTNIERTIRDLIAFDEDPSLIDDMIRDAAQKGISIDEDKLAELLMAYFREHDMHIDTNGGEFVRELLRNNVDKIELKQALNTFLHYLIIDSTLALKTLGSGNAADTLLRLSNALEAMIEYNQKPATSELIMQIGNACDKALSQIQENDLSALAIMYSLAQQADIQETTKIEEG